jgi:acyl carrier protein
MATKPQIEQAVLRYFRKSWPAASTETKFFEDLGLDPRQILDKGTELAEQLGCFPTRSQILACKTIGDLIDLLAKTTSQTFRTIPHNP